MIDMVDLFNACLYIQDHLDADLSLLFLARTVGLSRFAAATPIGGERYGVELLPNVLARARGEGNLSAKVTRLSCVGVSLDDWTASATPTDPRRAPRSVIRLEAGRYAVVEGRGSL